MKKKLVESNCPSDGTRKAAPAKQREDAQPIQSRRFVNKRPDNEDDWFTGLKEAEYEACFWYEIRRVRMNRHRASIMEQVEEIDNSGESEAEKFRQKLQLQEELDEVKRGERPWMKLTDAEKRPLMEEEPVQLEEGMTPLFRWVLEKNKGIKLWIDPTKGNNALMASFERLLTKMRNEGKAKIIEPGRPPSFKLRLFSLSVYRCMKRGMKPNEVWEHLAPLRTELWIGEYNRTRLAKHSRMIEREIGVPPS